MQNLKTPPSVSVSPNQSQPRNGVTNGVPETYTNGDRHPLEMSVPAMSSDPIREPDFLQDATPRTITPVHTPTPQESTVQEPERVSRSLRLQWRFWRTIMFAGLIFVRVMFWQVYFRKIAPNYVDRTNLERWTKYTREFRRFSIAQGGVFIKLGQFISTRVDILPEQIIRELESLQDEVPTIAFSKIRTVIVREVGDIDAHYDWIDETPIAAASLGQVHRARLKTGEKVVVKVQRPGIREICYTDLAAMRVVARIAMRFQFISRRADALGLVEEFGNVLLEELSYKHEAYNAARFTEMFRGNAGVYIPKVYYALSTDHLMTIEDVTHIKITDFDRLDAVGISRKAVAKRLMDTYLEQVFNHYFFHADPHPGNLFIEALPVNDENADFGADGRPFRLIFIDFGMTGTLTHEIADGMVTTLYSVLTRDAEGLIKSYQNLGFLLPGADIDRITEAAKAAFDQVWGLSMNDLKQVDYEKMVDLAEEFGDLMLTMPFYIPQDFIYLGRTISILSGMCTSLDAQFNPWFELQPYTETLIARGFGVEVASGQTLDGRFGVSVVQSLFSGNGTKIIRTFGEQMIRRTFAPVTKANDVIDLLKNGEIRVTTNLGVAHRQQLRRIEKANQTTARAVFFGSVLITSTLFYLNGSTTVAVIGWAVCALTFAIGVIRD